MTRSPSCLPAVLAAVVATAALGVTVGCAGAQSDNRTTLTVLAASSLTDSFTELKRAYERAHPGVDVRFSFAGSQHLAAQVRQGAPSDAIATADQRTMRGISAHVREPRVFAYNELVIAVPPGNPKGVRDLGDLARRDVVTVLAAPEVPAGRYAATALDRAGVEIHPESQEPSVRAVLTRVRLGEVDAGIVYASDAATAGDDVAAVRIPDADNIRASYPAAVTDTSEHPAAARAFVDWLRSAEARTTLRRAGFSVP